MNNTLGLDFFCKWAGFGMTPAILFIFVQIISKLNRIDLIKKKILFIQIILLTLIIISINLFKIEINYFQSFIVYLIIFVFNMIIYSDELDRDY